MTEEVIVTLTADRGSKYETTGECIGSYSRSIVFLPRGAEPDENVRVVLRPIPGRTDKGGRVMYNSSPAPHETKTRYKVNQDGTFTAIMYDIDWRFQLVGEEQEVETRAFATRENRQAATTSTKRKVVWGMDIADTKVEQWNVTSIPVETEQVAGSGDELVWVKTSAKEETTTPVELPVTSVTFEKGYGFQIIDPSFPKGQTISLRVYYTLTTGGMASELVQIAGDTILAYVQAIIDALYPVCACGRQRRDSKVADGYDRCELCRKEQVCARCGKKDPVTNVGGRLICATCKPYETAEQIINQKLTREHRQQLVSEAAWLLAATTYSAEEGAVLLRNTLDHVEAYYRQQWLTSWATPWYYFGEDGVFGSPLPRAALEIISMVLPNGSGNGLVEVIAWLSPDYYTRTQIKGEQNVALPNIDEIVSKLATGTLKLAKWLRGSEKDRLAALEALQRAEAQYDRADTRTRQRIDQAWGIMQAPEQQYSQVLDLLGKKQPVRSESASAPAQPIEISADDDSPFAAALRAAQQKKKR